MGKIYLMTTGEYSDYSMEGAFSSEEKLRQFAEMNNTSIYNIEEHDLDPYEKYYGNRKLYFVRMRKDGSVFEVRKTWYDGTDGFDANGRMYIYCYATDEKHAVKIANEKRSMLIAKDQWDIKKRGF